MPDKAKRRKNNKRKNKNNNKSTVNKNNSEFNDKQTIRSPDCQDAIPDNTNENTQSDLNAESKNNITQNANENQYDTMKVFPDNQCSNIDLNSESKLDNTESLCTPNVTNLLEIEEISSDSTLCSVELSNVKKNNKSTLIDDTNYKSSNQNPILNEATDVEPNQLKESKLKQSEVINLCVPVITNIFQMDQDVKDPPTYVVETPDVKNKNKSKLNNSLKSKSVDNDEYPTIVEITDETNVQPENEKCVAVVDQSNIIITDAETDVEWEKIDELSEIKKSEDLTAEAFSVTTIPLEIAQCIQTKSLDSEQEHSLRCYLKSLNLATSPSNVNSIEIKTEIEQMINKEIKQRLRKKGFVEDIFLQRGNISRGLDVIDEEASGESSATSRRHSYLSDKKSDNEELDDEVFEKKSMTAFKPNAFNKIKSKLIPQECILVDAKLKEPEVTEARGDWSLKSVQKITGAEVVYLTDSSSSTSSLYDIGDDIENDEVSDASVRIITPTIEVTDTEKFLTNNFVSKDTLNIKEDQNSNTSKDLKIDAIEDLTITENDTNLQNYISSTQHLHEIVVLSTKDIKTNLFVKDVNTNESKITPNCKAEDQTDKESILLDINSNKNILHDSSKAEIDTYDLEMKVLKCELNDAINNLIKEVISDSESTSDNHKDTFTRQDSSSSVCSSQCTAKYNPNYSSLNDVSNIMLEDSTPVNIKNNKESLHTSTDHTSHVKEVFQCVSGGTSQNNYKDTSSERTPLLLKDLCLKKIASFPFGNKILEELAHVSERLQSMSILALQSSEASELLKEKPTEKSNAEKCHAKMPYFPLPDISNIEKVSLPIQKQDHKPPPIQPRNSSLKKSQDEQHWTAIPTAIDPLYVCLSPSQKMLMEKTNTIIRREDATQLIDTHKKFIDRRGYNEKVNENIDTTPIMPFKSQTGSRLLALIRDPSVTNNINLSSSQNNCFKSLESLPKLNYSDNKEHLEVKNIKSNLMKDSILFKPIPPPRPRKFSSSFYESDESSDFTDNSYRSMRSERKTFHYSTGNLNKEIENDISSIQDMHRYYSNMRDSFKEKDYPRRPSLPKDLCDQQMEYIRRKEKEVEEEIRRLEQEKINCPDRGGPRVPLICDRPQVTVRSYDLNTSSIVRKDIFSDTKTYKERKGKLSSVFSKSQEELLREKMYSEYVSQMAEREQRRQQKFIKISHTPASAKGNIISKSMPTLDASEAKVNNRIEKEFISRARERWHKLGIEDPETEDEKESQDIYMEPKVIEHKIKVIEAGEEKDVTKLPSHLQEFVSFTTKTKEQEDGRSGESEPEQESAHVMVFCAVIILVLAVGKYVLRLLQNKQY